MRGGIIQELGGGFLRNQQLMQKPDAFGCDLGPYS
jgi:hypothetical protein